MATVQLKNHYTFVTYIHTCSTICNQLLVTDGDMLLPTNKIAVAYCYADSTMGVDSWSFT